MNSTVKGECTMRKSILAMLLALAMLASMLTGCGGNSASSAAAPAPASSAEDGASWSQTKHSTKLSYTSKLFNFCRLNIIGVLTYSSY